MHGLLRQLRSFPVLGKQHHLMPLAARLVEHFDAPAPGRSLAVVDFPQVEHLPLHYTLRGPTTVLHDAPITMFLAILYATRAAKKHTAHCAPPVAVIKGVGLHYNAWREERC